MDRLNRRFTTATGPFTVPKEYAHTGTDFINWLYHDLDRPVRVPLLDACEPARVISASLSLRRERAMTLTVAARARAAIIGLRYEL